MQKYGNLSGDSGVVAYEIDGGAITIEFNDGSTYVYDGGNPGAAYVAEMQRLARAGRGLSAYISQHVGKRYAKKLR